MESDLNLGYLELKVGAWADENFGDQPATYPLMGAGEEQGEGTCSVLKRLQGIDDSEKYEDRDDVGPEAEKDAVGDVVIYLADYFHRKDNASFTNVSVKQSRANYDRIDEIVLDIWSAYGSLCRSERSNDGNGIELNATLLLSRLKALCDERGYDFDLCVIDAWEEVSEREWDADVST